MKQEQFDEWKEQSKDNPQMLLWIATVAWSQRINPEDLPKPGPHPGPVNDSFTDGYISGMEPDQQYFDDVAEIDEMLEKNKNIPYRKWAGEWRKTRNG